MTQAVYSSPTSIVEGISRRECLAALGSAPLLIGTGSSAALVGAYTGNELANADRFARWFGRKANIHLVYFNQQNWDAFANSIPWIAKRHSGRPNLWSVPLSAVHGGFVEVAAGSWDRLFASCASAILLHAPPGLIRARIGWEMNLPEQEQSAFLPNGRADPVTWIAAYRRVVAIFRSASQRYRFNWCPNAGADHLDPVSCWPGSDVVDEVGIDLYFNDRWDRVSDRGASIWRYRKEGAGGLDWLTDLRRKTRKPISLPEWGINNDNATVFADQLISWIETSDLSFHGYWDSDAAIATRLSGGRLPAIGNRYRSAFL